MVSADCRPRLIEEVSSSRDSELLLDPESRLFTAFESSSAEASSSFRATTMPACATCNVFFVDVSSFSNLTTSISAFSTFVSRVVVRSLMSLSLLSNSMVAFSICSLSFRASSRRRFVSFRFCSCSSLACSTLFSAEDTLSSSFELFSKSLLNSSWSFFMSSLFDDGAEASVVWPLASLDLTASNSFCTESLRILALPRSEMAVLSFCVNSWFSASSSLILDPSDVSNRVCTAVNSAFVFSSSS